MINTSKLLVIGCGGHSRFILSLADKLRYQVFGLIDLSDSWKKSEIIMGIPVVGSLSQIELQYRLGFRSVVIGVGDNNLRKRIFTQLTNLGFSFPNIIHPTAIIDSTVILGNANVIGPATIIGAEVILGHNNIINSGSIIEHQAIIGNHNHVSLSATVCGNVTLNDCVFLGANSTVIEKLSVDDNTTIGAGGTLIQSTQTRGSTLVGCPAREV